MKESVDLVVVGAGIAGASTACFAARAGLRVVVVDRGLPAGGASGRTAGWDGPSPGSWAAPTSRRARSLRSRSIERRAARQSAASTSTSGARSPNGRTRMPSRRSCSIGGLRRV
jgi:glycine/D-amino acid oxidase-like deaminating enzyme